MLKKKILWTLIAVVSIGIAVSGVVDDTARDYADDAFKRALVTFAVARTLNGIISLAQDTELAFEPGGIGVNLGVGQILDPINDLIEQFSSVMLIAATSLGLQNLLLSITGWWGFTAALAAAACVAVAALWWPAATENRYVRIATRLLLMTLVLRFIVPALIIGTNLVTNQFLEPEQQAATAALEATSTDIESFSEESEVEVSADQSIMDRLGNKVRSTLQSMDIEARLETLRDSASNASEHIINLIVLFVLQTIILPILFAWLIIELLKSMIVRSAHLGSEN